VEEETTQFLSKREKRLLAKEQKREEREQGEVFSRIKKFGIWILVIGFLVAAGSSNLVVMEAVYKATTWSGSG